MNRTVDSSAEAIHRLLGSRTSRVNHQRPDPEEAWTEQARRALDELGPEKAALVEGECAWCGLVTVAIHELGCFASDVDQRGLCQFVCPVCSRLATKSVSLLEIKTLIVAGAVTLPHGPLELLEPKRGDAISWDDVLDFSLAFKAEMDQF